MAKGINKVIIVGNLGQDPETRYMPSGGAVTSVSVATSESWKDKNTGQQQERTEWHKLIFFNRLAEIAGEYLKKGSKIYAEGSLRTRKWQGQDGQDRYTTEIVVNEMQMLDARPAGGQPQQQRQQQQRQPQQQQQQPQQNNRNGQYEGQQGGSGYASGGHQPQPQGFDDFDDDIPF